MANGNMKGLDADKAPMNIMEFDENIEPYNLPDIPSILSIDRRNMQESYHFGRLSAKHPFLIIPSRKLVALAVEDDIPYPISGDPRCQPIDLTHELSIPCWLEYLRATLGEDQKTAVPAESKDSGDEMIEAALREIETDEEREKPSISDFPADERNKEESARGRPEEVAPDEDLGLDLVDENNGAPVKIPKRKLKEEIISMAYLISHRFKNLYGYRGKMRYLNTKKGAFQRELKE